MSASQVNANDRPYVPPELVYPNTVVTHVTAGTFAILCWDVLDNLNNDYQLLFKYRIGFPTVSYFVSRLGVLGYCLASLILEAAPTANCEVLQRAVTWMYAICHPATSLLFFFRVRAVFSGNKYVVWFFSFMWLAVLGAALTVPQAVSAMNADSTRYCTTRRAESFAIAPAIVSFVNDTLVLLATTVGFVMNTHQPTLKGGIRTMMYGDYLPAFSRAMLRDNQMYYLATVGCNLLALVMFCIHSLPVVYRELLGAPNIMLMSVMACRVFRNTKFGNQWVDPTISIPSLGPFQLEVPDANSPATPARGVGTPLRAEN